MGGGKGGEGEGEGEEESRPILKASSSSSSSSRQDTKENDAEGVANPAEEGKEGSRRGLLRESASRMVRRLKESVAMLERGGGGEDGDEDDTEDEKNRRNRNRLRKAKKSDAVGNGGGDKKAMAEGNNKLGCNNYVDSGDDDGGGNVGRRECDRINKTLLINISFLVLGVCEAIRGPTLLDLQDVYDTELETITLLFLVEGVGSLIGSFATGYFMNRHPSLQYLTISAQLLGLAVSTALTPHAPDLMGFFGVVFFVGALVASVHTGGNILCLGLWSGSSHCGPHIHAIHFFYSFGAFLAPLFAAPFLSQSDDEDVQQQQQQQQMSNGKWMKRQNHDDSRITVLYPAIGFVTAVVSYGYWHYGIEELLRSRRKGEGKGDVAPRRSPPPPPYDGRRNGGYVKVPSKDDADGNGLQHHMHRRPSESTANEGSSSEDSYDASSGPSSLKSDPEMRKGHVALAAIFSLFLFLYVGMEYCYGTYLTTFAVKSSVDAGRREGARATAIFWGAFSLMRFLAIFASSARVRPVRVLVLSFAICLVGGIAAATSAEKSMEWMAGSSAVLGFGMGTVFATGLAWIEDLLNLNNWLGTMLVISGTIGPDVFPVVVGQYMEDFPELLIYLNLAVIVSCILLFAAAFALSRAVAGPSRGGGVSPTTKH